MHLVDIGGDHLDHLPCCPNPESLGPTPETRDVEAPKRPGPQSNTTWLWVNLLVCFSSRTGIIMESLGNLQKKRER